jgi:hypothetical protein
MLRVPDALVLFADSYLKALDEVAAEDATRPKVSWRPEREERRRRTEALAEWHLLLLDGLMDTDDAGLDRLSTHYALGGPELAFFQAHLAHRRGDLNLSRTKMYECLTELPGHPGLIEFVSEIDAPMPPDARRIADDRARAWSGSTA